MTTTQIATYADVGGLAGPDVDLQILLRRKVVPDFLDMVGYAGWRRKYGSATVTAGSQTFDVATDFHSMKALIPGITVSGSSLSFDEDNQLSYIGDNPDLVLSAEACTTQGTPSGYYLIHKPSGSPDEYRTVKLNCPVSTTTVYRYVYYNGVYFSDDSTSVNLSSYIPAQHQWALVGGLKREPYEVRLGVDDPRYQRADAEWQRLIAVARKNREKSGSERPRFVN